MPMTLVFQGTPAALGEAYLRIESDYPFSGADSPDHPVTLSAVSTVGDCMSVLDCIEAVTLDEEDTTAQLECIKRLVQCSTYEDAVEIMDDWGFAPPGMPDGRRKLKLVEKDHD